MIHFRRLAIPSILFTGLLILAQCSSGSDDSCTLDADCPGTQVCRNGDCVNNPCGTGCPSGQYCDGEGCVECTDDLYCGANCIDCTALDTNRTCVAGECGCDTAADCAAGEECIDVSCTSCAPDCSGKCGGASDGCDGTCTSCNTGEWCDSQVCRPCDTDEHCGSTCTNCAGQSNNKACVGGDCGCVDDNDCANGESCESGDCTGCIPDCAGKCGGASDGCSGTCDSCPDAQWCDGQECKVCNTDDHCGPDCKDCTALSSNRVCVSGTCGCHIEQDCGQHERCIDASCLLPFSCPKSIPSGYATVFIARRSDGLAGSGSAYDPYDGSSATKFDALLRGWAHTETADLAICIGPGIFETRGYFDHYPDNFGITGSQDGFSIGDNWKILGSGQGQTTLRLIDFFGSPPTLKNTVLGSYSDGSDNTEIAYLTIDGNYSALKALATSLGASNTVVNAIFLRSLVGGHWIHDVTVKNVGNYIDPVYNETFPIMVGQGGVTGPPVSGVLIELVTIPNYLGGGPCTAIAVYNVIAAEVRNNSVTLASAGGAQIAYGGWVLQPGTSFHDNTATNVDFGFNIDSLANSGVLIQENTLSAGSYGIVVGGGGAFDGFVITGNTISGAPISILLNGQVTNAIVQHNYVSGTIQESGVGNSGNTIGPNP